MFPTVFPLIFCDYFLVELFFWTSICVQMPIILTQKNKNCVPKNYKLNGLDQLKQSEEGPGSDLFSSSRY